MELKAPQALGGDCLQNPSDPEAGYHGHRGQGYLVQVMESYQEEEPDAEAGGASEPAKPDLITHVSVGPINRHDSSALMPALADTQARGIGPEQVVADTHYGSEENVAATRREGVELISPAQAPAGSAAEEPKLGLEEFELDEAGRVVRCPAGHGPVSTSVTAGNCQALMERRTCEGCAWRERCPVQRPRNEMDGTMRVQYDRARVRMRARRLAEREGEFVRRYGWRAGVEATMSRLKHWLGLAWLRVRGWGAVRFAGTLRALGLNILRCGAYVAAL